MIQINNKIKNLEKDFSENRNSHVFLVETNNTDSAYKDVLNLIKKILDANEFISSQIDNNNYLELIVLEADGKDIKKDKIEYLQKRIKSMPILSDYIFYIILNADLMNLTASNKLLKTLEEPNNGTVGFLITENINKIIPTIKSRCEYINVTYDNNKQDDYNDDLICVASKIVELLELKDLVDINLFKNNEKLIKNNEKKLVNLICLYYNSSINICSKNINLDINLINCIKKNNPYKLRLRKAKYLNSILDKKYENMNQDLFLEKIFIELKEMKV